MWCYGPSSDPCSKSNAGNYTWSGIVCDAKGKTCKKPIKQLTAKWTGPFKCRKKDKCKAKDIMRSTHHAGPRAESDDKVCLQTRHSYLCERAVVRTLTSA